MTQYTQTQKIAFTVDVKHRVFYCDADGPGYKATVQLARNGRSGSFKASGLTQTFKSGAKTAKGKSAIVQGTWQCSALVKSG